MPIGRHRCGITALGCWFRERKSVEPMAALTAPARVAAQHQSLLHFVGNASWSDERVLAKVRELVLPSIEREGPIEAWIIDDTGFPKKGRHSVGVTRQYCGQLGRRTSVGWRPSPAPDSATGRADQVGGGGEAAFFGAFVHISAVEQSGIGHLNEGQKVGYEIGNGRNGKSSAGALKAL
jgi:hypothetical protein